MAAPQESLVSCRLVLGQAKKENRKLSGFGSSGRHFPSPKTEPARRPMSLILCSEPTRLEGSFQPEKVLAGLSSVYPRQEAMGAEV